MKTFLPAEECLSCEPRYILRYKNYYFIIILFFLCMIFYTLIGTFFFIDFHTNYFDIAKEYLFYGGFQIFILRIFGIACLIGFFVSNDYYLYSSVGDIFIYDNFLVCKPKLFFYKEKKFFYDESYVYIYGKPSQLNKFAVSVAKCSPAYDKMYVDYGVPSVIISNSNIKGKNFFDMIRNSNMFFLVSPACSNDKSEVIESYNFVINKINNKEVAWTKR